MIFTNWVNCLLLQLSYAIEIGAELAYLGHYIRTRDSNIYKISNDEFKHQKELKRMLKLVNCSPNTLFNFIFSVIGIFIFILCQISPKFLLNKVALFLEIFAINNYNYIGNRMPFFKKELVKMAKVENEHKEYFNG